MQSKAFRVGDKVYFGRPNGEQTLGEVVKVNRKKYKVKTLESRGHSGRQAGTVWGVPESLMRHASTSDSAPASKPKRASHGTRSERASFELRKTALMTEITAAQYQLSTAILSCDGYGGSANKVRQRSIQLKAKLEKMYTQLGTLVAEEHFRCSR